MRLKKNTDFFKKFFQLKQKKLKKQEKKDKYSEPIKELINKNNNKKKARLFTIWKKDTFQKENTESDVLENPAKPKELLLSLSQYRKNKKTHIPCEKNNEPVKSEKAAFQEKRHKMKDVIKKLLTTIKLENERLDNLLNHPSLTIEVKKEEEQQTIYKCITDPLKTLNDLITVATKLQILPGT